jgi:hypothetical protein
MTLQLPNYIQASHVQNNIIRYEWDDWNIERAQEPFDKVLYERLLGVGMRANVAFTIGTAEWIVYRFGLLADDPLPLRYLEAAWAQMIDWRYGAYYGWQDLTKDEEWKGPVKGPVGVAMSRVMYAIQQTEESGGDPSVRATWISSLARYVIPVPEEYQAWRESVLKRLETIYARDRGDPKGEVVPKEAIDPEYEFRVEQTESLVNDFLTTLDCRRNAFLHSPDQMLAEGFRGTPYVFNREQDRKTRV